MFLVGEIGLNLVYIIKYEVYKYILLFCLKLIFIIRVFVLI